MAGAVLMGSLALFTGCDDDDSLPGGSVVGTWNAEKVFMVNLEGVRSKTVMDEDWTETVTFNEDGSWSYSYIYNGSSASGTGYYTDDGTVIRINGQDDMAYTADGDRMSWFGSVDNGTYEINWKRQS